MNLGFIKNKRNIKDTTTEDIIKNTTDQTSQTIEDNTKNKKKKILTINTDSEHNFNFTIGLNKNTLCALIIILAIVVVIALNPFKYIVKKENKTNITKEEQILAKTKEEQENEEEYEEIKEKTEEIEYDETEEEYEENDKTITGSSDELNIHTESGSACDAETSVDYDMRYYKGNFIGDTTVNDKFLSVVTSISPNKDLSAEQYIYKDNTDLAYNYFDLVDTKHEINHTIAWIGPRIIFSPHQVFITNESGIVESWQSEDNLINNYRFKADFDIVDGLFEKYYNNSITKTSNEYSYYYKPLKKEYFKIYKNKWGNKYVYKIANYDSRNIPEEIGYAIRMDNYTNKTRCIITYTEPRNNFNNERALQIATSMKFVKPKSYQ